MIANAEYNNLLNKFNRVVAQNNDLQEQLKQHRAHMEKREQAIKIDFDKVRKLCEAILSKDRDEMVVGAEYAWRNIAIRDLIEKAMDSYAKYNKERSAMLLKIADLAEDRLKQIESLTDQISQMEIMAKERGSYVSAAEAKEVVETKKSNKRRWNRRMRTSKKRSLRETASSLFRRTTTLLPSRCRLSRTR